MREIVAPELVGNKATRLEVLNYYWMVNCHKQKINCYIKLLNKVDIKGVVVLQQLESTSFIWRAKMSMFKRISHTQTHT